MTTRIEPDLTNTEDLLGKILTHIVEDGVRVMFLVPAGESFNVLARIRTMISRKRSSLQRRGVKPRHFRLHSSVHRETHDGIRYDAIVVWKQTSDSNMMLEHLEDLLANG